MDRQLTAAERDAFSRDGVVHIRGAVDPALAQRMLGAVDRWIAGSSEGAPRGLGMDRRVYAHDDEFRSFVFESGLAAIAGDALDSEQVRIYFDQIFVKGAETARVFPWHQDHPYWPIRGTQVCSTWVALTAATVEASALEFVAGSHRSGTTYRPVFGDGSASVEDLNRIWDGLGDYVMSFEDEILPFEDEPERCSASPA